MHAALEPIPDLRQEARTVANQFEAIFAQSMISGMRKTADMGDGEGMFGKEPGADTYAQWFDTHMSSFLSKNGQLGVADILMKEFERLGQVPAAEQPDKEQDQR